MRTYDHELGGAPVRRPYTAVDGIGPADGTVVIPTGPTGTRGLAVGIGVNPLLGDLDAEAMAWSVVDEAVRNVVCAGGDPRELSLLDNFAWGDPTDPVLLGRLVAACRGCHDAAIAYGAPFVSGKDSLYNQYRLADGTTDPVASTLVITAVAPVADVARIPLVGLDPTGGSIWLVGPVEGALEVVGHPAMHLAGQAVGPAVVEGGEHPFPRGHGSLRCLCPTFAPSLARSLHGVNRLRVRVDVPTMCATRARLGCRSPETNGGVAS